MGISGIARSGMRSLTIVRRRNLAASESAHCQVAGTGVGQGSGGGPGRDVGAALLAEAALLDALQHTITASYHPM